MNITSKGQSPFYPGQPVPTEFFAGRHKEIERIDRAIQQVAAGKPQAIFLTGEYGIGKSSLAGFMRQSAEKNNRLLGIHVLLGGVETLDELAEKTVSSFIREQYYKPTFVDNLSEIFSKYLDEKQTLFGINLNLKALKEDSPNISSGYLPFLREIYKKLAQKINGIMLILDEINGITKEPKFSHFIKSLIDENALSPKPLPLLLTLCGVEERRAEMVQNHRPVERIFDIVEINPMDKKEMKDFFTRY